MKIVMMTGSAHLHGTTATLADRFQQGALDAGHEVCGVFTRRDKPVGRKQILTAPPVKELALAHGIPVFQPDTLKKEEEQ